MDQRKAMTTVDEVVAYLDEAIAAFRSDPPANDYRVGYSEAFKDIRHAVLGEHPAAG